MSVRFRRPLQQLAEKGIDALKPQLSAETGRWSPPVISNRIAKEIRKQAVRDGSFGNFDSQNLMGWDAAWDMELAMSKRSGSRHHRLRKPKTTTRVRNREERAQHIESAMKNMNQRMDQYWSEKQEKKPAKTIENMYKDLMKGQK